MLSVASCRSLLLGLALLACGCMAKSVPTQYGSLDLKSGRFTPGPGFKPGDVIPKSPAIESPIPTEIMTDLSKGSCYLVSITGELTRDYDLNNDNRPSGYILVDERESRSPGVPGGRDAFRIAETHAGRPAEIDALLARLAGDGYGPPTDGRAKVLGWLSGSGTWPTLEVVSVEALPEQSKGP
jgi:hypothetical protein